MKTDFLKGLGLETEVINQIMAEHGKTLNREKEKYEAKVSDYNDKTLEINALKSELTKYEGKINEVGAYKTKYEEELAKSKQLQSEFDKFKTESENKYNSLASEIQDSALWEAGKELLQKDGFNPAGLKHLKDKVLPHLKEGGYENGEFKNWDTVGTTVRDKFSDFYTITEEQGTQVPTPPNNEPLQDDSFLKGLRSAKSF